MLVKFNPFGSAVARDPFFDDFFSVPAAGFEPRIDVKEDDKEFLIRAELPGMNKDDFKLSIENNVLTLEGEKKNEFEDKQDGFFRSERTFGAFKRSFRLTDSVDAKNIKAQYEQGVLNITVPKAEKAKPKLIDISVK